MTSPLVEMKAVIEEHCRRGWHHVEGPNVRMVDYYATSLTEEQKRELLGLNQETTESGSD
jgi:hypothetical protein